jgi:hypothetical protein
MDASGRPAQSSKPLFFRKATALEAAPPDFLAITHEDNSAALNFPFDPGIT